MTDCTPGQVRPRSDGTYDTCIGGFWVPVAAPFPGPIGPKTAIVIDNPDALHALASNPEVANRLSNPAVRFVLAVEYTEPDDEGESRPAGTVDAG